MNGSVQSLQNPRCVTITSSAFCSSKQVTWPAQIQGMGKETPSGWEELQSHMAKDMDIGKDRVLRRFYNQSTLIVAIYSVGTISVNNIYYYYE